MSLAATVSRTPLQPADDAPHLLLVDDDIRQLTLKNVDSSSIKRSGVHKGMLTLLDDGARKVLAGETTLAEVLSVTQEDI